jgi:hypothetical protein
MVVMRRNILIRHVRTLLCCLSIVPGYLLYHFIQRRARSPSEDAVAVGILLLVSLAGPFLVHVAIGWLFPPRADPPT